MELERLQVLLKRYGKLSLGDAMERIAALEAERERDAKLIERLKKALEWALDRVNFCEATDVCDEKGCVEDRTSYAEARAVLSEAVASSLAEAEGRKG